MEQKNCYHMMRPLTSFWSTLQSHTNNNIIDIDSKKLVSTCQLEILAMHSYYMLYLDGFFPSKNEMLILSQYSPDLMIVVVLH